MERIDHLLQNIDNLHVALGLNNGDYDEHGANRRAQFNRNPKDKQLWDDLEKLEAELAYHSALDLVQKAEQLMNEWLVDNTEQVFEEQPAIDTARGYLNDALNILNKTGHVPA